MTSTSVARGSNVVNRFLSDEKRNAYLDRIEKYPSLTLTARQWSDVAMIATGVYSPLTGFLGEMDYKNILNLGRLSSGLVWAKPILLLVHSDQAEDLKIGEEIILRDRDGKNLAMLHLEEIFRIDRDVNDGSLALAGPIEVIRLHEVL